MRNVSVREAREHISQLLASVERGEEVVISRHGKPVARLEPVEKMPHFSNRTAFRSGLPQGKSNAADLVRRIRDEERY